MKDGYIDFDKYIVASEPHKHRRTSPRRGNHPTTKWQRRGYKNGITYNHKK